MNMLLAPLVLAAFLSPQETPPPVAPAASDPSALKSADVPAGSAQPYIDAGLTAFRKRRFAKAEIEFRKAMEAEPQNAAAAFYLGYTYYKIAEPKRHDDPGKQQAAELFAKAYAIDPKFQPAWKSAR